MDGETAVVIGASVDAPQQERLSRSRPKRGAVLAVILLMAGSFGAGAVVGWGANADRSADRSSPPQEVVTVAVPDYSDEQEGLMPDVRGLLRADAMQVLADVGISADRVAVSERQAAGPVGAVLEQDPVFGVPEPKQVRLVVSMAATVPEIKDAAAGDLIAELNRLGAEVEVVEEYVPGAVAGDVVAIKPAPGGPLPALVTLTVAEAPGSVYLADLDPVEGSCSSTELSINGTVYDSALECSGDEEGEETAWIIGRDVDVLETVIGIPDNAAPEDRAQVDLLADGREVASVEVRYGEAVPVRVKLTGALRFSIRVTTPARDGWGSVSAAMGGARLLGSADALAALSES